MNLHEHFSLSDPLDYIYINQGFGENKTSFYEELGLKGHTGLDLRASTGTPFMASISGTVVSAGQDSSGGVYVKVQSEEKEIEGMLHKIELLYYHLESYNVIAGEKVSRGQMLGTCDNTGRYTTGSHLHFSLTPYWKEDNIWKKDYNNGYWGSIDPEPFFTYMPEKHNPYNLAEHSLIQLAEGHGGFGLFTTNNDGDDRFYVDELSKILASWEVKNNGDTKGKTNAVSQIVWDAYKPHYNLKNEVIK